jgi:FKBP-type peptidyl-prolyl cis-trans isomerase
MLMLLSLFINCEEQLVFLPFEDQLEKDLKIIDEYLDERNIVAEIDPETQMRYVIHKQGDGERPLLSNIIKVNYEGRLLKNDKVFDDGENIDFQLNFVITGWKAGLRKLNEGGSMTLYIPSGYAYGPSGSGRTIPPNSNLIFDIDFIEIVE